MTHRVWATKDGQGRRFAPEPTVLLAMLALLTLIAPLWANLTLWLVEYLGFDIDPRSGQVTHVALETAAAEAGMQPGDQLRSLYGRPWTDLLYRWDQWQVVARNTVEAPVVIEREGVILTLSLSRRSPEASYQIAKIVFALLGAACWVTGSLLGLGRRHEVNGSRLVAGFWLLLGGVLGSYVFAVDLCLPLLALLLWVMTTILPALAIALHVWFPARQVSTRRSVIARRLLFGAWVTSNLVLAIVWFAWRPSPGDILLHAWLPLVVAMLAAFLGSGTLLVNAYRHVRIAHVRRQIRLIAAACLITGCAWLVFRLVPLFLGLPPLLPNAAIDLVPIIIPLAYLVSGVAPNLYTLDRLARRVVGELLTVTLVAVAFSVTVALVAHGPRETILWSALVLGILSQPLLSWTRRLSGEHRNPDRSYAALRQARHLLTTSLDPALLLAAMRDGVQGAFDQPPIAIYYAAPQTSDKLNLMLQDRLPDLPPSLPLSVLANHMKQGETVIEARELHAALQAAPLSAPEEAAVRHQGVALWCVARQGRKAILALVLIGTDTSLEPYRAEDRRELEELMDASGLAFAHSGAYERIRLQRGEARRGDDDHGPAFLPRVGGFGAHAGDRRQRPLGQAHPSDARPLGRSQYARECAGHRRLPGV